MIICKRCGIETTGSYCNRCMKCHRELLQLKKLKRDILGKINKSFKIKGYSKIEQILGCSCQDFKLYLESKFEPWMNWNNKGKYNGELNFGWDLDHIIPMSTAKTEEDIIKLNHYTNFQPLCSYTNRYIKRDKR